MRRRTAAFGLPVAAAALAAAILVATGDGSNAQSTREAARSTAATSAVRRRTLVDRKRVDGTLGYAGRRSVVSRLAGTITTLPHEGDVVRPGHALFTVDGDPVVLMDGAMPAYRLLRRGLRGRDVTQLERGLAAAGYGPGPVDGTYDAATVAAVEAWQRDRGMRTTGDVELGRVVFLPGARRVTKIDAELGAAAAAPVLSTTSTRRIVTVRLDAADQGLARRGNPVRVELPDGRFVSGRIASVGRVATADGAGQGDGSGGDSAPKVTVTITLRTAGTSARMDEAPVSVELVRSTRRRVRAVPVQALVARPGGGYAVQREDGRLVPVGVGFFAGGYVELTTGAVAEGDRVRVPR
jgi:peptidoglycan hydrolase-like protein with peptidoglycan-binding domain